ncbi:hypothetical protein [Corynebacterium diphtheriae]|uniref:hypothetical protein n=1 Tax=Corynebacterium diphtheriae TaxID=1717 RepID=UPI00313FE254
MKLSPHCSLPLTLGGTTDQVASQCYEHEIIDNDFVTELEGFIDIENIEPGDEGRKMICRVENGRCVTVTMAYLDLPITDTFLGLGLNYGPNAKAQFLAGLRHQGVEVIAQSEYIILPNDFVTIELGESITWWDRAYWGTDGFRNEAIALQP